MKLLKTGGGRTEQQRECVMKNRTRGTNEHEGTRNLYTVPPIMGKTGQGQGGKGKV